MKIHALLAALTELETNLADKYRQFAAQHKDEHDLYHQCWAFAARCETRAERIANDVRYDNRTPQVSSPLGSPSGPLKLLHQAASQVVHQFSDEGLRLLADLRRIHSAATEAETTWAILGQGAQAARDPDLSKLFEQCHHESEMEAKWLLTRIKTTAPQALLS
jgi:hypothetical protein